MHLNVTTSMESTLRHAQKTAGKLAKRVAEGRSLPIVFAEDLPPKLAAGIGTRFCKVS